MRSQDLPITGMDCPDCARTLEQGVAKLEGVSACAVNFGAELLSITFDPQRTGEAAIVERIRSLGYELRATPTAAIATDSATSQAPAADSISIGFFRYLLGRRSAGWPFFAGGALVILGLLLGWAGVEPALSSGLYIVALAVAGFPIARSGLQALMHGQMTINLLMTIAGVGAVVIGEPAEAATLVVLFTLGEALEGFTMQRSRDSLRSLMQLAPAEATVLSYCIDCAEHLGQNGYTGGPCPLCAPHEQRLPVAQVAVGQTMLVKPGERVPLDGTVIRGRSSVSQQHITGESLPVERSIGDTIYAGSVNGDGALELAVTSPANETLLSRIADLVTKAQGQRAPIERFIDRFAAYYTPGVVIVAALVAILPPLLFNQPFWNLADGTHGWLYRALSLLVIACPCALVISTPVSVVSALSAATRAGVLVKGGAALEALRRVKVIAFDKTGTLTSGKPHVTEIRCADTRIHPGTARVLPVAQANCSHCDDLLALAAAVEGRSAHPLAGAVVQAATERQIANRYAAAEDVVTMPGRGVYGRVNGRTITVGSHTLFDAEHEHTPDVCAELAATEARGQTVLMVCACENGGFQGYIAVADTVRPEAARVLHDLSQLGIAHTAVLTGDNPATGNAIARAAGVAEARSGLLPAEKLAAIHDLAARYGPVAMVGDGINDTPALAAASVGIAMGAAGSAQALETADIALMNDDLTRLPFLLRLSRRLGAVIRQNITVSLVGKLAFLALTLVGWSTLWLAVVADVGLSLLVTLNGMRLLRE